LSSGEMVWLFIVTLNEAGLCFREVNSIKLVLLLLRESLLAFRNKQLAFRTTYFVEQGFCQGVYCKCVTNTAIALT